MNSFATQATLLIISIFIPGSAFARNIDFSILGALTHSSYQYNSDLSISTQRGVNFGGGVTVGMEIDPFLSLETGLFYLSHTFSFTSNGQTEDKTLRFVDIPVLLRFLPITQVALYFGPYYGIRSGASSSDMGLLGGAGFRYPLTSNFKLRIDGMYQFGFANLDPVTSSQNSRNILVWAGLMFETW